MAIGCPNVTKHPSKTTIPSDLALRQLTCGIWQSAIRNPQSAIRNPQKETSHKQLAKSWQRACGMLRRSSRPAKKQDAQIARATRADSPLFQIRRPTPAAHSGYALIFHDKDRELHRDFE
jgi:hypothetical protein